MWSAKKFDLWDYEILRNGHKITFLPGRSKQRSYKCGEFFLREPQPVETCFEQIFDHKSTCELNMGFDLWVLQKKFFSKSKIFDFPTNQNFDV